MVTPAVGDDLSAALPLLVAGSGVLLLRYEEVGRVADEAETPLVLSAGRL
jgi:hypothetical protein